MNRLVLSGRRLCDLEKPLGGACIYCSSSKNKALVGLSDLLTDRRPHLGIGEGEANSLGLQAVVGFGIQAEAAFPAMRKGNGDDFVTRNNAHPIYYVVPLSEQTLRLLPVGGLVLSFLITASYHEPSAFLSGGTARVHGIDQESVCDGPV